MYLLNCDCVLCLTYILTNVKMADVKIITFNCAGMANSIKRTALSEIFRRLPAQIILTQETHSKPEDEAIWTRGGMGAPHCSFQLGKKHHIIPKKWSINIHKRPKHQSQHSEKRSWRPNLNSRRFYTLFRPPSCKHLCASRKKLNKKRILWQSVSIHNL